MADRNQPAGPLAGLKAVELAVWVAGPCAAAYLGDLGVEVLKIESLEGDPYRGLPMGPKKELAPGEVTPGFLQDNRNKRGIALNLKTPEGHGIAWELIRNADILVTNLRLKALHSLKLDYETLSAANPRLIYGHISGYGLKGPDAGRASYDIGAYWARAGMAHTALLDEDEPLFLCSGSGDHDTGLSLVGAICGALVNRLKTGRGQMVSVSLYRVGAFLISQQLGFALAGHPWPLPNSHAETRDPLAACYKDCNGKWFYLHDAQGSDEVWHAMTRVIERPDLERDGRFGSYGQRLRNAAALIEILDQAFTRHPRDRWAVILGREGISFDFVQSVEEVMADPQARAAGLFEELPAPEGKSGCVSLPFDFSDTPWRGQSIHPQHGQHTEEVLLELGYSWEDIAQFKDKGVIP
jgi:crotonobetainyl-CoA:carnitine CoA-transferase CaiB-like acyl-CoA transferase